MSRVRSFNIIRRAPDIGPNAVQTQRWEKVGLKRLVFIDETNYFVLYERDLKRTLKDENEPTPNSPQGSRF